MSCVECGAPLSGQQRRFCSRPCNDRHHGNKRVPITCAACGRNALVRRRDASTRRYCSRACYAGHFNAARLSGPSNGRWRGGRALAYGPGWKRIKLEVRARDRICRACGATPEQNGRALDVHHLQPFRFSGDNSLENLVALCRSCHMRADDHGRAGSVRYLRRAKGPTKREIARLQATLRRTERDARRAHLQRLARELRAAGFSLRSIARDLGVSHETVANWLRRANVSEDATRYAAA